MSWIIAGGSVVPDSTFDSDRPVDRIFIRNGLGSFSVDWLSLLAGIIDHFTSDRVNLKWERPHSIGLVDTGSGSFVSFESLDHAPMSYDRSRTDILHSPVHV